MKTLIVQTLCFSFLFALLGTQARILPDYPLVKFAKTYGKSSGNFYEFQLWKVVNRKPSHSHDSPTSASLRVPANTAWNSFQKPAKKSPPSPESDPSHRQTPKVMPCIGSSPCSIEAMETFLNLNPKPLHHLDREHPAKSSPPSPETDPSHHQTPKIMPCTESSPCNTQAVPAFYKPPKSTPPSPATDPSHRQTPRIMPCTKSSQCATQAMSAYYKPPKSAPPSPENDPSHRQTPRTMQVMSTSYENKPKHPPPPPQGAPETRQTPRILPCTASNSVQQGR